MDGEYDKAKGEKRKFITFICANIFSNDSCNFTYRAPSVSTSILDGCILDLEKKLVSISTQSDWNSLLVLISLFRLFWLFLAQSQGIMHCFQWLFKHQVGSGS